jgi:hypothetical protein
MGETVYRHICLDNRRAEADAASAAMHSERADVQGSAEAGWLDLPRVDSGSLNALSSMVYRDVFLLPARRMGRSHKSPTMISNSERVGPLAVPESNQPSVLDPFSERTRTRKYPHDIAGRRVNILRQLSTAALVRSRRGVEGVNARCVGSGFGSVIRVAVERIIGIRYRIRSRAVEYENDEKLE